MYFSAENLSVNPVVMNYKIRYNKNRPARYSFAWPDCCFVIIYAGRRTEKHGLDMQGYVQG